MKGQRLPSKIAYQHFAVITTSSGFPVDMLRYDCCFPVAEADSRRIAESINPRVEDRQVSILVSRFTESSEPRWTYDRWRAFQCEIESVNSEYQHRRNEAQVIPGRRRTITTS